MTPASRWQLSGDRLDLLAPGCHHVGMHHRTWLNRVTYDLSRVAVRVLGGCFCRFRFTGGQNIPAATGGLFCSNHQSYLDPVLLGAACDRRLNYLAREELFQSRFLGSLIRWYDAIPIQRDGLGIGGLKETLKRLKRGELVLIFPEGTRTTDGQVQELKAGFCVLARRAQVPIIPVGLEGPYEAWPRQQKLPRPARLAVSIGPPIWPDQFAQLSDEQLRQLLAERIKDCHQAARQLCGKVGKIPRVTRTGR